jgi:D-tyrosyl-tRNA(Tyr) deacylase
MRAIVQRVTEASVAVDGTIAGRISLGLVILLGVGSGDGPEQVRLLADKIVNLRIFADEAGRFNRSLLDVAGGALVVSQFTLYADTRRGRRPSFSDAAPPAVAAPLVEAFCEAVRGYGVPVATGVFGAHMYIALVNDGPVTIMLDTEVFRA